MLERLHKVLANAGVASRRRCEELILGGQVTVDGKVVTQLGVKVDPAKQKIAFAGQPIRPPKPVTIVLHKPRRCLTTTSDDRQRRTVMQFVEGIKERVYPVGRLDWDSEGLLIMTNDGDLANKLTHPRFKLPRTYHVRLKGEISGEVIEKLRKGVWLSEGKTGPVRVFVKKRDRVMSIVEVTITEGMNREVRRVFAKYGLKVRRLKRIKLGPLNLGPLAPGQWRTLTHREIELLKDPPPEKAKAPRPPRGEEKHEEE
jgi:23S rRNA pseudouridine2605 synthase